MARRPLRLVALLTLVACSAPLPPIDPLPGAPTFDAPLARRLADALAGRGRDYRPRTHHLRPNGSPRWTNRLILDPSPYLLQHAHNPVNWYPWGDEAFARAVAESKPVLLSVGYSTCHWCHVMEEESFEDEEIATYLNQHYIAIKVDREVRPDVDDTYMTAVQLLTGSGGWPMTVWLTPGRQPFYGGTYFPPRDGVRGVKLGFLTLLQRLRGVFADEPLKVAGQADSITRRLQEIAAPGAADALPGAAALHAAFARYDATFDDANGGFGSRIKFPEPPALDFLLRYQRRTGSARALAMVTVTLDKMAAGGIHDHVAGGFHRYTTDPAWQVPHFEKMLYDNAQLAMVALAAWQATGRDAFAALTRDVLDYLARDVRAPGGGFYAATDADSEGEEGRFFVWTPAEVRAALEPPQAEAVIATWDVTDAGNFHGRTIPHLARTPEEVATRLGVDAARVRQLLAEARPRLYTARERRVHPHRDDKILAGWNGLAISAFARAGAALEHPAYVERARSAARFVLDHMRPGGRLRRSFADGAAHGDAFLDDFAYLVAGLLDLYDATSDLTWLKEALALQDTLDRDFADPEHGGYFLTSAGGEQGLVRHKPDDDGALPSGNAVAAQNLLRLAELTGDDRRRARADGLLRALGAGLGRAPALLGALEFRLDRPKEIVVVRPAGGTDDGTLLSAIRRAYVPNRVLTVTAEGDELTRHQALVPLVADKQALRGRPTAYVCEQRVCALPTSDPTVLADQLRRITPLPAPPG